MVISGPGVLASWLVNCAMRCTRLVRTAFIVVLLLLVLPYLLVPLYRVGHPVSTLMLARWFTGQNVTREWLDLAEIAPALPLTVIAAEDARFCSHRGIDWDALQDAIEEAQDGEAGARRLDHHPADRQEPVSLVRPQLHPQGAGVSAGALDRPGAAERAGAGDLSQHGRVGP